MLAWPPFVTAVTAHCRVTAAVSVAADVLMMAPALMLLGRKRLVSGSCSRGSPARMDITSLKWMGHCSQARL